jgi:hypothetical protein
MGRDPQRIVFDIHPIPEHGTAREAISFSCTALTVIYEAGYLAGSSGIPPVS